MTVVGLSLVSGVLDCSLTVDGRSRGGGEGAFTGVCEGGVKYIISGRKE